METAHQPAKIKEQPAVGDMLAMDRTGEPLRVVELIGEGGQGLVYRVQLRTGAPLALKWYKRIADTPQQREAIRKLAGRRCPHPAFLFPLDTVTMPGIASFGYVMPWMDARFVTFLQVVNSPRPLGLQTKARIGRRLAEAFGALHASGLCYRDINFGNLWLDPQRGDIAVIDNDNVGVDDGFAAVWGSLRFMAPEVIRREHKPSTITDLHSLAVLLYFLLMHGHPLDGRKVESSYTWDPKLHRSEEELALQHYGHEPIFSFDPNDDSNRPTDDAGPTGHWPLYPTFVQNLFVQAFTVGLHDASLSGRVLAGAWRDAMTRMYDLCMVCPTCTAALIHDPDVPQKPCWNCGRVPPRPPVLQLREGRNTVLLHEGASLTSHHLTNDRDYDTVLGAVETHPRAPSGLILRNRSKTAWTTQPAGEPPVTVAPGQAFAIRDATIDFGTASGVIRLT